MAMNWRRRLPAWVRMKAACRFRCSKNSQDYGCLAEELERKLEEFPDAPGVLLSRHGLYTWGDSVAEARRHLEALEFLFEVEERRQAGGSF